MSLFDNALIIVEAAMLKKQWGRTEGRKDVNERRGETKERRKERK